MDSKRQLEESLKWACNSFIQHASDFLVAESLVSLLKMAQAFLPPADAPLHEQVGRPARPSRPSCQGLGWRV